MTKKWSFKLTPTRKILIALVIMSLILAIYRLATGLGVSTNLNDKWPWGLWIGFDLTAVALAGAGYSICFLVHVLHIERFKIIARRALLFSFLGYIFVLATLILEIGRWDNFWRPFISWGIHSPMFEVYMCISVYTFIQLIEFAEIFVQKFSPTWYRRIEKVMPVVVILGALLPFGHQASLGAIYLIVPHKLHPLWWSSLLPWFFLITSFFVGPAIVAIEALWAGKIFNSNVNIKILRSLIRISGGIMVAYLALKVFDLINRNAFQYLFTGGLESSMFLLEMVAGIILPVVICFSPWGTTKTGMVTFGILTVSGVVLNRVNVVFTGMYGALGAGYTPAGIEWGISIGLLSLVVLAYIFIVENFNIYHAEKAQPVYEKEHVKGEKRRQVSLRTSS